LNIFFRLINGFKKDTVKQVNEFSSAVRQLLSDNNLSAKDKALLKKVSLRVHPKDGMYITGEARHYLSVGLSTIRCIESAFEGSNGSESISSILDLPCGYGRVLRFLKPRFPDAEITASEVDDDMLRFCERAFSVNSAKSNVDFDKLNLNKKFDLIWCGSLITHLDVPFVINLLKFFYRHLSPNGMCVFTTHGKFSADSIQKGSITYGLSVVAQNEVLSRFHETGYGYADYENQHGYGISAVSHERMLAIARDIGEWDEVLFMERGWDNHQDVYGFAMPTSYN